MAVLRKKVGAALHIIFIYVNGKRIDMRTDDTWQSVVDSDHFY